MRIPAACALLTVLVACAGAPDRDRPQVAPSGPPTVSVETVGIHARELDGDVGERPAGSQQEQAASIYITAHLQQAGYVVFLDAVPVGNLVRSTNVVARPPAGGAPRVVVVAAYDTPRDEPKGGEAVGLLLELARALRVSAPDHDVEFVALGAEHAAAKGALLGSRRLAQELVDGDGDPFVVALGDTGDSADCAFVGGAGGSRSRLEEVLRDVAHTCRIPPDTAPHDVAGVFEAAGIAAAQIGGDTEDVAAAVMEFLMTHAR